MPAADGLRERANGLRQAAKTLRRLANGFRRLPETHFRAAMGFTGTAKPIVEPANELPVALMIIRKALKRPGESPKAVAGTAMEIEVRWKGKEEGASLGAPPPNLN